MAFNGALLHVNRVRGLPPKSRSQVNSSQLLGGKNLSHFDGSQVRVNPKSHHTMTDNIVKIHSLNENYAHQRYNVHNRISTQPMKASHKPHPYLKEYNDRTQSVYGDTHIKDSDTPHNSVFVNGIPQVLATAKKLTLATSKVPASLFHQTFNAKEVKKAKRSILLTALFQNRQNIIEPDGSTSTNLFSSNQLFNGYRYGNQGVSGVAGRSQETLFRPSVQ